MFTNLNKDTVFWINILVIMTYTCDCISMFLLAPRQQGKDLKTISHHKLLKMMELYAV